ncbi:MAG TPA: hypothetical protein VGM56_31300 [Byssovorax sp.]|jgi:hypothetical protein
MPSPFASSRTLSIVLGASFAALCGCSGAGAATSETFDTGLYVAALPNGDARDWHIHRTP